MTPTREELLALAERLREPIPWEPSPRSDRPTKELWQKHAALVDDQREAAAIALRQIAEAMEAVRKIEFFHDGLASDLHDVPDKTSAYVMGWDAALAAIAAQQGKE